MIILNYVIDLVFSPARINPGSVKNFPPPSKFLKLSALLGLLPPRLSQPCVMRVIRNRRQNALKVWNLTVITCDHVKVDDDFVRSHSKVFFDTKNVTNSLADRSDIELL